MSRHNPHLVTPLAWRITQIALLTVLSLSVLVVLLIVQRGSETQAALTVDHFDERWQIRSGAATPDRLVLNPAADAIGVALRPIDPQSIGFTLQTRVQFDQPSGAAGLIVQAADADHFLAFLISPDGYFRLSDYRNGVWIDRVAWRAWPHIRRAGLSNVLRAECRGDACTFFINAEWTWQAVSIPATTKVGVVAAASPADTGKVVFDQLAAQRP